MGLRKEVAALAGWPFYFLKWGNEGTGVGGGGFFGVGKQTNKACVY